MDENELRERRSFLSDAEMFLGRNQIQTVLDLAEVRLKRLPGDLDARIMICRVLLMGGKLDEAREMLREMEDVLSGLMTFFVSVGSDFRLKKELLEAAQTFHEVCVAANVEPSPAVRSRERFKAAPDQLEMDLLKADEEAEEEEEAQLPDDFQTVTLAELYVRQGHLPLAAEVLETILRKDPQQEKAAGMLREVREAIDREESIKRAGPVIAELSRWLGNIAGLSGHAA
jgi:hypothetical protein